MMFHVVRTDNFARSGEAPGHDEYFVTAKPVSRREGEAIIDALNGLNLETDPDWYVLQPADYKLVKFEV